MRSLIRSMVVLGSLGAVAYIFGPKFYDAYYIKHAKVDPSFELRERPETKYGILHKTRNPTTGGSLHSLTRKDRNIHYLIDRKGNRYPIVPNNCIANHAGISMWDGDSFLNRISVGIEFVADEGQELTNEQYAAGRDLIEEIQGTYHISDVNWLEHGRVAHYRETKRRGRSSCGWNIDRRRLGLDAEWDHDPDVGAGRLRPAK